MNQVMRVGNGIVVAIERPMRPDQYEAFTRHWRDLLPDVPVAVIGEAQIVQQGDTTLFQFTGNPRPELVAEFQKWWEETNVK